MTGLEWEAPPERVLNRQRKTPYTEIAAALRDRAGEWATLPGADTRTSAAASTLATNIRRGKMKDFPEGEFEALHDESKVYVRFVGQRSPAKVEEVLAREEKPIREWARLNGFPDLPDRGRLPAEVHEAYVAAQS